MVLLNGNVFLKDLSFQKADLMVDDRIKKIVVRTDSEGDEKHGKNREQGFFAAAPLNKKKNVMYMNFSGEKNTGADFRTEEIIDLKGKYVIPGLVDIHTHGVINEDASDGKPGAMEKMAHFYASRGITSWCPTTMTLPEEELLRAMKVIRTFAESRDKAQDPLGIDAMVFGTEKMGKADRPFGRDALDPAESGCLKGLYASCAGIHLEGPFLSERKKGAQAAQYLRKPDLEMLKRLNEASGGRVRMITVAPEEDADFAFIRKASEICTVSLGHSSADYDVAAGAFAAGASHVTHMYNGMNGIYHRDPGIIGAAFDAGASVELICDGFHIRPSVIRMSESMFQNRITLISDSMRCTGMPDGKYSLGGQPVFVKNKKATLQDGTLAGSSVTLMDALKNMVDFGIPLERAVRYATSVPASVIGMDSVIGKIGEGFRADLLVLDQKLNLEMVIKDGKCFTLP